MAQPSNTYDSYDMVGIREDLSDTIYDVSPDETPALSMLGKTKAKNTYHEWQTDSLRTSKVNAYAEGDDSTPIARTPTVRLGNYTQIMGDDVSISGTDSGLNKAGRNREMARELQRAVKTIKLDAERALFANQARDAGSDDGVRYFAGIPAWLNTNIVKGTGAAADPTGDGTDARTDGTQVAFSQARFNTLMRTIWNNSGQRKDFKVFLDDYQMETAIGFTGNNNARTAAEKGKVDNYVNIYMTQYGRVEFVLDREVRSRDIFVLDIEKWKIAELRGMSNKPLGITGDNTKRMLRWEWTLEACNEGSSGGIFDNTTS